MDNTLWLEIRSFLQSTLGNSEAYLDEESIEAVKHYINHDEYEMAFEGLFIEIIKLDAFQDIDLSESRKIGVLLKLDKESVFDVDFWSKFEAFQNRHAPTTRRRPCP